MFGLFYLPGLPYPMSKDFPMHHDLLALKSNPIIERRSFVELKKKEITQPYSSIHFPFNISLISFGFVIFRTPPPPPPNSYQNNAMEAFIQHENCFPFNTSIGNNAPVELKFRAIDSSCELETLNHISANFFKLITRFYED